MYFKKKFLLNLLFLLSINFSFACDNIMLHYFTPSLENANIAYQKGDYERAINNYLEIPPNEIVFFNLANSYAKADSLGKSILNYERALKLNPKNTDAIKNLAFVKTKLKHDLNELPELFFVTWWKNLVHLFKADTWAWIVVAFAWFALIALAFKYFSKNKWFQKIAGTKFFIFIFIAFFSFLMMKFNNGSLGVKTEMILIKKQSQAKDAPSSNAKDVDLFFEGTKLETLDSSQDFYKTKNADKKIIWVLKSDFEII